MRVTLICCGLLILSSTLLYSQSPSQDNESAANAAKVAAPTPQEQQQVQSDLKDIYFDFNRFDLRPDDQSKLQSDADWLKAHPDVFVTIEGDADDRGDIVYNVALSDKRASITHDTLISMGVPADRIVFSTGWGKLYPVCSQDDEPCWSENRRAQFALWGESGQSQIGHLIVPSTEPHTQP